MALFNCGNRLSCTGVAIIASVVIGIVAAFLQITGVITVTPAFLWVVLGIAIVYLAVVLFATSLFQRRFCCEGLCFTLSTLLIGILGAVLFSIILLAITFAATSVIGAIVVGLLLLSFSLAVATTACLVKCFANCDD